MNRRDQHIMAISDVPVFILLSIEKNLVSSD
jgi:hypothetical protein